jgi:hypothetical protein
MTKPYAPAVCTGHEVARAQVVGGPVEGEEVAALAHGPDHVGGDLAAARRHRGDRVVRVVVRRAHEVVHPGVGDDVLLAAAVLPVEHARDEHARLGDDGSGPARARA